MSNHATSRSYQQYKRTQPIAIAICKHQFADHLRTSKNYPAPNQNMKPIPELQRTAYPRTIT
jgi:hypothetical protein